MTTLAVALAISTVVLFGTLVRGARFGLVAWVLGIALSAALPPLTPIRVFGLPAEYLPAYALVVAVVARAVAAQGASIVVDPRVVAATGSLVTYAVLSLFWSSRLELGLQRISILAGFAALAALLPQVVPRREWERLAVQVLRATALFAVLGSARRLAPRSWVSYSGDLTPFLQFRSSEVVILMTGLLCALVLMMRSDRNVVGLAAIVAVGLLGTESRTGAIGAMVLIVAAALGNRVFGQTGVPRPRIGRRWIGLVSALGAGVLVHGMLTGFDAIRRIATSTLAVRIWTDDDLSLGELGGRRRELQDLAVEVWSESFWGGAGVGDLLVSYDTGNARLLARSHNLYLSYGAELGAIGLALLLWMLFVLLVPRTYALRANRAITVASAAMLALVWLFQELISSPYVFMYIAAAAYLATSAAPQTARSPHDTGPAVYAEPVPPDRRFREVL